VYFDEEALHVLAESIKQRGLIQPVAVMARENDYVLVAGERRWRAAQLAGIQHLPVIILDPLSDQELLEYALVENLQREDLNCLEEARAYQSLQRTFSLTAEEIADRVGKSRPAIANALRLLTLAPDMQEDLESGRITAGHARAILSLEKNRDQTILRDLIVMENLSVRQAELRAREMAEGGAARRGKPKSHSARPRVEEPENVRQLREQLVEALACKVAINTQDGKRGRIEIYFESLDELQFVLNQLGVES
jgi:ParB family chromosome partitioning protein